MPNPLKLAAFGAVLIVALGAALGLGRLSGVDGQTMAEPEAHDDAAAHDEGGVPHGQDDVDGTSDTHGDAGDSHDSDHSAPADGSAHVPDGLQVAADGYAVEVLQHAGTPGSAEPFDFRIIGPDGAPVTDFVESHEADLHLIAVRRDLTGYQHVHPEMSADGTWTVPLAFDSAGAYRVFADFRPADRDDALTLGVDVGVGGDFEPAETPHPNQTAEVDGYAVRLDGELTPGQTSELTLSVSRDGEPVSDLQPYLGAAGHLVALRRGDLAYLHVHPEGSGGTGPDVGFAAEVPSTGSYGLFFEFQHEGTVHTAEFTLEAGAGHDH